MTIMYNTLLVGSNLIITDEVGKDKSFSEAGFSDLTVVNSDAHAMAMLRRSTFDLILLDAKYDSLISEMAEAGISVPIIVFANSCNVQQAHFYIRHGVLDVLPMSSGPVELIRSLWELSPRLQLVQPVHLQEIDAQAVRLYDILKKGCVSEAEVHDVFRSIVTCYNERDEYRGILATLCNQIERRLLAESSWVLLFYPFTVPDLTTAEEPGVVVERFFLSYAEKISVFHLERMNSTANSVCQYLVRNLTDNPSMEKVAKVFGISKSSLSRLFSEQIGIPFRNYRRILRQEYTKHMLLNSTYRIQEISRLLGCQSTDYFTEQFRLYQGCTPSEFRRRNGVSPSVRANGTEARS